MKFFSVLSLLLALMPVRQSLAGPLASGGGFSSYRVLLTCELSRPDGNFEFLISDMGTGSSPIGEVIREDLQTGQSFNDPLFPLMACSKTESGWDCSAKKLNSDRATVRLRVIGNGGPVSETRSDQSSELGRLKNCTPAN